MPVTDWHKERHNATKDHWKDDMVAEQKHPETRYYKTLFNLQGKDSLLSHCSLKKWDK